MHIVKQVYDINAEQRDQMYQFQPDYMEVETGDTVRFLGTVGRHTVHSVRDMLPEGVQKIGIMPHGNPDVVFDRPGIYGIQCKLHQRHGMVALIVVGGDLHNLQPAREGASKWISPFARPKMHRLLDQAQERFGSASQ